jgi:hypothetical protein
MICSSRYDSKRAEGSRVFCDFLMSYILEELKMDPIKKKLAQYKQKLLNHVSRMEDIRYPKQLLDY